MKRSKMVSYLHKLLNTFDDYQLDEVVADEILEGLENMGMIPPMIDNEKIYALIDDGKILKITYPYGTNAWLPEDFYEKEET